MGSGGGGRRDSTRLLSRFRIVREGRRATESRVGQTGDSDGQDVLSSKKRQRRGDWEVVDLINKELT